MSVPAILATRNAAKIGALMDAIRQVEVIRTPGGFECATCHHVHICRECAYGCHPKTVAEASQ